MFELDHRTLERWVARYRATGSVAPRPKGGGWHCPIDLTVLHGVVRERSDSFCAEWCRTYISVARDDPRRLQVHCLDSVSMCSLA